VEFFRNLFSRAVSIAKSTTASQVAEKLLHAGGTVEERRFSTVEERRFSAA